MIPKSKAEKPLGKALDSFTEGTIIVDNQSEFQRIQINQHPVYGNQLIIDGDLQISESDNAYNTAMVAPLLSSEHIENIAILGGGDGGVLQEALTQLKPREEFQQATLVEIDSEVIRLCKQHMPEFNQNAYDDPQSEVIVGDALNYIENTRRLDAVIYDLTMDPIRDDMTHEQYITHIMHIIRKSLRPGGIFSMQCCGQVALNEENEQQRQWLMDQIHRNAEDHFIGIIEQQVYVPSFHEQWTFLAAVKPES